MRLKKERETYDAEACRSHVTIFCEKIRRDTKPIESLMAAGRNGERWKSTVQKDLTKVPNICGGRREQSGQGVAHAFAQTWCQVAHFTVFPHSMNSRHHHAGKHNSTPRPKVQTRCPQLPRHKEAGKPKLGPCALQCSEHEIRMFRGCGYTMIWWRSLILFLESEQNCYCWANVCLVAVCPSIWYTTPSSSPHPFSK